MLALLVTGSLAWDLQSPFNKAIVQRFAISVKADVEGTTHEAEFTMRIESLKGTGEKVPVRISWVDLKVDGNETGQDSEWSGEMDQFGQLTNLESGDDALRRMLTPLLFSFPNKSVNEKDKFESKWLKPDQMFAPTFSAEILGSEGGNDPKLCKIASKLVEKGDDGIRADGTWWFKDTAKIAKFEIDLKNWVVPMAGPELVSAKITGKAID